VSLGKKKESVIATRSRVGGSGIGRGNSMGRARLAFRGDWERKRYLPANVVREQGEKGGVVKI